MLTAALGIVTKARYISQGLNFFLYSTLEPIALGILMFFKWVLLKGCFIKDDDFG
jgi:hypothetical protein